MKKITLYFLYISKMLMNEIYPQKVLKLQRDQSPKAKQLSNRNTCLRKFVTF